MSGRFSTSRETLNAHYLRRPGKAVPESRKRLWIAFAGWVVMSIALTVVAGAKWSLVVLLSFAGYVLLNLILPVFLRKD